MGKRNPLLEKKDERKYGMKGKRKSKAKDLFNKPMPKTIKIQWSTGHRRADEWQPPIYLLTQFQRQNRSRTLIHHSITSRAHILFLPQQLIAPRDKAMTLCPCSYKSEVNDNGI